MDNTEKKLIEIALEETDNKLSKAADLLGIQLRSFRYKIEKLGINIKNGVD